MAAALCACNLGTTDPDFGSGNGTGGESGATAKSGGPSDGGVSTLSTTDPPDASSTDSGGGGPMGCGNGVLEGSEECDTSDFGGNACADYEAADGEPFTAGTLACTVTCDVDTTGCTRCGNALVEGAEVCDGTNVGDATCIGEGFEGGRLACAEACDGLDPSGCFGCGNGVVDGSEDCDSGVGGQDCLGLGFSGGALACAADCAFDTSGCFECGDGVVNGIEVCDCGGAGCNAEQLASVACTDLAAPMNGNFTGGGLGCLADCSGYDETACTWCGDGAANGNEPCEGADLAGSTCVDAGFLPGGGGSVSCDGSCWLDATMCTGLTCGGSLAEPPSGAGACPAAPWSDTGSTCARSCAQLGVNACNDPVDCPTDRDCEVACAFNACNGYTINCADGHACDVTCAGGGCPGGATINCPPDAPCTVNCSGFNACNGLTVVCPAGNHACEVVCGAGGACPSLDVQCGDGPCSLACDVGFNACGSAGMTCGSNGCTATCDGASTPNVTCGGSCACAEC